MAKKTTIVATFPNGDIMHRTTNLSLTHAWRVISPNDQTIAEGFSGRLDLAEKAARAIINGQLTTGYEREIVKAEIVDAKEFAAKLIQAKPFRVFYQWIGDTRKPQVITETGNKAARWSTRDEAAEFIRKHLDNPKAYYHNATLTIVDDRETKPTKKVEKKTGFRVEVTFKDARPYFLKEGRSHRRFNTREAAQTYIDAYYPGVARITE